MASSRRSPPADGTTAEPVAQAPVCDAVRDALAPYSGRNAHVAVALSGGRDSIVLLDAIARIAPSLDIAVSAVHVHHGLSPNADAWARFCAEQCASRGIALIVHRIEVTHERGDGVESAARRARYRALAEIDADAIALAHHADDQAETVLLQLLRGAGPHGLAAMPPIRASGGTTLIRPLLALARSDVERYAASRSLTWIEDESNDDVERARNWIRHELAPRIAAAVAGYPTTLARAAAHQAEAAQLVDELAQHDADGAIDGGMLARDRLAALAPHRARNLLRWWLRMHGLRAPSTARLHAIHDQLLHAANDARVRIEHDGVEIGIHRGRVVVHAPPIAPYAVAWRGEAELALPHGVLEFAPATGEGLAADVARANVLEVRSRRGGERIRLAPRAHRQPLKDVLHRAGIAHWARADIPLVFIGDALAAVPGIGVDVAFRAAPGKAGYALRWRPQVGGTTLTRVKPQRASVR